MTNVIDGCKCCFQVQLAQGKSMPVDVKTSAVDVCGLIINGLIAAVAVLSFFCAAISRMVLL